jgi:uncharacterized OsmC-like protein
MHSHTWSLRVSAGGDAATVFARRHQFVVGAPVSFDEEDARVSALEYALGALGADVVNGLVRLARERRVAIDHAEAVVEGALDDPLAHVGVVGAAGSPAIAEVRVKVYAASDADEEDVRRIFDDVLGRSPLVRTLGPVVRLDLSLTVTP